MDPMAERWFAVSQAWFAYDVDDGFSFHDTEAEARACAEEALDRCCADASGQEWSEDAQDVCWGSVLQRAVVISREPAPEGADYDETIDYGLVDVPAMDRPTTIPEAQRCEAVLRGDGCARPSGHAGACFFDRG